MADKLKTFRIQRHEEEKRLLLEALNTCYWQLLATARHLGVQDSTLRSVLKRHPELDARLKDAIAKRKG
jgi:transcriptional regulator with GAF, ATPase, and Fis domain